MSHRIILIASLALGLTACATAPEKTCSAEWIEYQVDRTYDDLRREMRGELKSIRNFSEKLDNGGEPGPLMAFRMIGLAKDMKRVAKTFSETTMPRLEELSQTCDRPDLVSNAFAEFLRKEGAPDGVVGMVRDMGVIMEGVRTSDAGT